MSNSNATRITHYAIAPQFIERWSPRSFTDEVISEETLFSFFEAARWAPSASNHQPWRFIYSRRGATDNAQKNNTPSWNIFLSLLNANNRAWAQQASALVVIVSKTTVPSRDTGEEVSSRSHAFDAGAAWAQLALQANLSGWATHGIGGFDRELARKLLNVPEHFAIQAAIAIGKQGNKEALSAELQQREQPNGRLPLQDIIFADTFKL